MTTGRSIGALVSAVGLLCALAPAAWAQPSMRIGHALRDSGEAYSMSGKGEAKAAWVDGAWWAVLSSQKGMDLYRLQGTTWVQETFTGSHLSDDPNMRADVVWDGTQLIVLATNSTQIKLWVFAYARPSFRLHSGFPVTVVAGTSADPCATDVATVAEDSRGRLWVAYRGSSNVGYVKASSSLGPSGWMTWKTPVQIGFLGNGVAENASNNQVVAFTDATGPKIGLVWSDQSAPPSNAYRFRWRLDSSGDFTVGAWSAEEVIYTNGDELVANDQLQVVAFEQKIYVTAKSDTSPLASSVGMDRFYLFTRDPLGNWTKVTMRKIERTSDTATRPEIVIDGEHRLIYAFWHDIGIEGKVTSVDSPNFLAAGLVGFVEPSDGPNWNAQSTHQIVDSRTGLLVLADDPFTGWQYWNLIPLGTPEASNPVSTLSSITVAPAIAVTQSQSQVQFTATGRDQHGAQIEIVPTWSATGGSIDQTGLFTSGITTGVFGIAATQSETGHATVFVSDANPVIASIAIRPDPSTVFLGQSEQLTAVGITPTGGTVGLTGPVTWSVVNGVGAITTSGLFTAPSSENRAFVQATAQGFTTFATISIVPAPPSGSGSGGSGGGGSSGVGALSRIVVSPASPTVAPNGTLQFSATGQDASGNTITLSGVTWSVSNGTISKTGLFTAPGSNGSATVTATTEGLSGSTNVTIQSSSPPFTGGGHHGGGGGCALIAGGGAGAGSFFPLLVLVVLALGRRRLS